VAARSTPQHTLRQAKRLRVGHRALGERGCPGIDASRNATAEDFRTVMAAMRAGQIPDRALATHRLALADVPAGFARLLDPQQGAIKAIVEC